MVWCRCPGELKVKARVLRRGQGRVPELCCRKDESEWPRAEGRREMNSFSMTGQARQQGDNPWRQETDAQGRKAASSGRGIRAWDDLNVSERRLRRNCQTLHHCETRGDKEGEGLGSASSRTGEQEWRSGWRRADNGSRGGLKQ